MAYKGADEFAKKSDRRRAERAATRGDCGIRTVTAVLHDAITTKGGS